MNTDHVVICSAKHALELDFLQATAKGRVEGPIPDLSSTTLPRETKARRRKVTSLSHTAREQQSEDLDPVLILKPCEVVRNAG